MEEDGTKVSGLTAKLESDFNKLGLSLYEANGDLKDTYQILADLAEVFPSLNTEQKAYYTELIAGKTRAQVAAAVLNNFDRAVAATETALDSAGSAAEENAKVLDSLNGHIKAFKAEWESLANSKATQDTLKLFVDFGTAVVKLINSLGGLKTVVIGLATAFVAHKIAALGAATATATLGTASVKTMTSMQLFGLGLKTIKTNIVSAIAGLKLYAATTAQAGTAMITASQAAQLASARMVIFGGKIAIVIAVLALLISTVNKVKQKIKEWEAAEEEKNRKIIAGAKEAYSQVKELSDVYDEYKRLADIQGKSYEQEEAYANAVRNVAEALGYKTSELSEATIQQKEYIDMLENAYDTELKTALGKTAGSIGVQKKSLSNKVNDKEFRDKYETNFYNYGFDSDGLALYLQTLKEVNKTEKEYKDIVSQGNITREQAREKVFEFNTAYERARNITEALKDDANNLIESYVQQEVIYARLNNTLPKTTEEQENFVNSILDAVKVSSEYRDTLRDIVLNLLPSLSKENNKPLSYINEIKEEIDLLKELNDAYAVLEGAFEEYNENGNISVGTLQKLITEYPEYIQYLIDANGNIRLNKDALDELVKAKKEDIKASIIQDALNRIDHLKEETEEEKALAEQINKTTEELKKNNQARFEALALLPEEDLGRNAEAIKKIINDAIAQIKLLDSVIGGGSGGSKNSKTADAWKEAFTKAYNELKNKRDRDLIETAEYIDELEKLNEKYFKDRIGYEEEFAKYELEVYKERKNLFNEYIDDLEHEYKMLENQGASEEVLIAKYKEIQNELHRQAEYYRSLHIDENNDLIQKLKEQWWKYQKDIEKLQKQISDNIKEELDSQLDAMKKRFSDLRDVALDAIEKQIDEKNDWLEEQNKMLDEQIDKLEEERDKMEDQKEIQDKLLKIEEARKKLAEAKNKRVRVYREGRGFVYEQDFDAVTSAQQELNNLLDDWNLFQEKARIAEIIDELENEKQANKDRVNAEISDLNKLKDAWDKSLDLAKNVEDYQGWLQRIEESENDSFEERLNAVKQFVESYNNEMALLKAKYNEAGLDFEEGEPNKVNAITKSYGGVSYNPDIDYQKLINEAVASGAPEDHLAYLEKKRNAKILGEGIEDYTPTYNYTSKAATSSSSGNFVGTPTRSSSGGVSTSSGTSTSSSSGSKVTSVVRNIITGIGNAIKSITGLAEGTTNADGLVHLVGEGGPELYVPPQGSSIIPSGLTSNLMAWGSMNPMDLVSGFSNSNGTTIEIGNISLPNVKDGESFVEELKNFKNLAVQQSFVRR